MDKEIFDVLQRIKTICSNMNDCHDCPFGDGEGYCGFGETFPNNWELIKDFKPVRYFEG